MGLWSHSLRAANDSRSWITVRLHMADLQLHFSTLTAPVNHRPSFSRRNHLTDLALSALDAEGIS